MSANQLQAEAYRMFDRTIATLTKQLNKAPDKYLSYLNGMIWAHAMLRKKGKFSRALSRDAIAEKIEQLPDAIKADPRLLKDGYFPKDATKQNTNNQQLEINTVVAQLAKRADDIKLSQGSDPNATSNSPNNRVQ